MKTMAAMSGLKVLAQRAWLAAVLLKTPGFSSVFGSADRAGYLVRSSLWPVR
jgi:hypothetical protein